MEENESIFDVLSSKWSISIIKALSRETLRHGQLQAQLPGVSQRMLTQTLRSLERNGILERTVYPVVPPRVDYSLTALGGSLIEALEPLQAWAISNSDSMRAANLSYTQKYSTFE